MNPLINLMFAWMLLTVPSLAAEPITIPVTDINYLVREGHEPRDHWYSLKPGKHYWLYSLKDGKGEYVSHEKLENVADLRPMSERNCVVRFVTNVGSWMAPLYGPAVTALVAVTR